MHRPRPLLSRPHPPRKRTTASVAYRSDRPTDRLLWLHSGPRYGCHRKLSVQLKKICCLKCSESVLDTDVFSDLLDPDPYTKYGSGNRQLEDKWIRIHFLGWIRIRIKRIRLRNTGLNQCCGSGSVLDPYSGASWIRIRILNTDPDPHMQI